MGGRLWTLKADRALQWDWGEASLATLAQRLGRTQTAIVLRARKLGLRLGGYSLVRVGTLARTSGYDDKQIVRAIQVLGIELQPIPSTGARAPTQRPHLGLTEEQTKRVFALLARHRDGERYPRARRPLARAPQDAPHARPPRPPV